MWMYALNLLVMGMGSVFAFLGLLVLAMKLLFLFSERSQMKTQKPDNEIITYGDDKVLVAVITAAVQQYRNDIKK